MGNLSEGIAFYPGIYRTTIARWFSLLMGSWKKIEFELLSFPMIIASIYDLDYIDFQLQYIHCYQTEDIFHFEVLWQRSSIWNTHGSSVTPFRCVLALPTHGIAHDQNIADWGKTSNLNSVFIWHPAALNCLPRIRLAGFVQFWSSFPQ